MQRRAFELQAAAGAIEEAPDPLEQHPEVLAELQIPTLLAAGEDDMPDFRTAAEQLAEALPLARQAVISGAAHLAPLEAPAESREDLERMVNISTVDGLQQAVGQIDGLLA